MRSARPCRSAFEDDRPAGHVDGGRRQAVESPLYRRADAAREVSSHRDVRCSRGWDCASCSNALARPSTGASTRTSASWRAMRGSRAIAAAEIGIKTYQQRGSGTDFKQLSRVSRRRFGAAHRLESHAADGEADRAEFQDERDQCVMLLSTAAAACAPTIAKTHRHDALRSFMNAIMAAVVSRPEAGGRGRGDDVRYSAGPGAIGDAAGGAVAQRADGAALRRAADADALRLSGGGAGSPAPPAQAGRDLVITNFRDEDSAELHQALRLLRSRNLVLLARLRERIVGELIAQPLTTGDATIEWPARISTSSRAATLQPPRRPRRA